MILKRNIAAVAALVIGASCCSGGMAAAADQKEGIGTEEGVSRQDEYILGIEPSSEMDWEKALDFLKESVSGDPKMDPALLDPAGLKMPGMDSKKTEASGDADDKEGESAEDGKEEGGEGAGAKTLQMPQKLDVTIDPWEVDGKGQIYSERYVIQNTGEAAGVLTLSGLTCRPQEGSGVSVRTDRDGIHGDDRKSIYMEMIFGTGERIVLSEEGSEYKTELRPGEEVTLEFTGEVNEHASGKWDNKDVAVKGIYSWKLKENVVDVSGDVSGDVDDDKGTSNDVSGDAAEGDTKTEVSGDVTRIPSDAGAKESPDGESKEGPTEMPEISGNVKEMLRTIDLDFPIDAEILPDSWTEDKDGYLTSIRYMIRNTGSISGILRLSDPVCKIADKGDVIAQMRLGSKDMSRDAIFPDREGKPQVAGEFVYKGEECIRIGLASGDAEKPSAGQEESEDAEYEVGLKPGEELAIYFVISQDGMIPEGLKDGKAMVAVGYSWKLKEEVSPAL